MYTITIMRQRLDLISCQQVVAGSRFFNPQFSSINKTDHHDRYYKNRGVPLL